MWKRRRWANWGDIPITLVAQSTERLLDVRGKVRCMAKLIYAMTTSLDGYTEDEHGRFGWGAPEDEETHTYIV
jgi:hypothetical protein